MRHTPPLIAVVDDDQSMLVALGRLLRAAGFAPQTFPSGAEFLESLKTHPPDCVLLDLNMPHLDGFAVQARLVEAGIRLPVIFITAQDSVANRDRALAAGASACLGKPVTAKTLLAAISAAITPAGGSAL